MTNNYRKITIWVALEYVGSDAKFLRQLAWLHHTADMMVNAYKIIIIRNAAQASGKEPDYTQRAEIDAAFYHIRKSRLLTGSMPLEEQDVREGDTLIFLQAEDPRPTIKDLMDFVISEKYPETVGDKIPLGKDVLTLKDIGKYTRKRAAKFYFRHVTGDVLIAENGGFAIKGHHILNDAVINSAIDKVLDDRGEDGEATASLIKDISEHVENAGNVDANDLWEEFNKKLVETPPKKSILNSMWQGLVGVLPSVAKIAEAAGGIAKLYETELPAA
jgi:hypothetical protein